MDDAIKTAIDGIAGAIKSGHWWVAIGLTLVWLTQGTKWISSAFKKDIPANWQPWIAAIIGVIGATGVALASGVPWWQVAISGIGFGATAGGLWSLAAKHVLRGAK